MGFFSRPSNLKVVLGKLEPNVKEIKESLAFAGISSIDAVIPMHSHYDHAMDAPEVVNQVGGILVGSESSLNIGRAHGLLENQMKRVDDGDQITIGKFKIKFVIHPHWEYPIKYLRTKLLNNYIEDPFEMPSHCLSYKEGDSYTLIIEHENTKVVVHGSVGYYPGALEDYDADILFLGISGLAAMNDDFLTKFEDEVVNELAPKLLVPIHWDNLAKPLSKGLKNFTFLQRVFLKVNTKKDLAFAQKNYDKCPIKIMQLWKEYSLSDLMQIN